MLIRESEMRSSLAFALLALSGACSISLPAQGQEIYNPVPGALAVNAQLEHEKGKSSDASLASERKAIRDEDFACRMRVVNAHARGSDGRKRAMAACDSQRDAKLRALDAHR
jgi:hypothetical protein